jgi:Tfp pilus assembly PilM family ATPase/Tfp pilus assembly protein PilN
MMLTTLNISSNAVKYLVARGTSVVDWGKLPLPDIMHNGIIRHPRTTGDQIKSLFASKKLPRDRVICSFNGLPFSYRLIALPKMAQPALNEAVTRAARREMPVSLDDTYLSWQAYPDGREEWEFLVLGVTPPPVDALVQTLSVAGIKPFILDIKHLLLAKLSNRRDAIIVDFEPDYSHIALVADGIPVGMHTVPSLGTAAQLRDEISMLIDELVKMVGFYNSSHPQHPLSETTGLLLTGESSTLPNVAESIQNETGYRVEPLTPPLGIPPELPVSEYAANIGAVMKNIVLDREASVDLPPFHSINLGRIISERKAGRKAGITVRKLLFPIALAVGAGLLITAFQFQHQSQASVASLQSELAQANQELNQTLALVSQAEKLEGDISKLTASTQQLLQKNQAILRPEEYVSDLALLTRSMPDNMSFTSIDMQANQIVVKGTTDNPSPVVQFARNLEASGAFHQADIIWIKKTESNTGGASTPIDTGISFMVIINK